MHGNRIIFQWCPLNFYKSHWIPILKSEEAGAFFFFMSCLAKRLPKFRGRSTFLLRTVEKFKIQDHKRENENHYVPKQ